MIFYDLYLQCLSWSLHMVIYLVILFIMPYLLVVLHFFGLSTDLSINWMSLVNLLAWTDWHSHLCVFCFWVNCTLMVTIQLLLTSQAIIFLYASFFVRTLNKLSSLCVGMWSLQIYFNKTCSSSSWIFNLIMYQWNLSWQFNIYHPTLNCSLIFRIFE